MRVFLTIQQGLLIKCGSERPVRSSREVRTTRRYQLSSHATGNSYAEQSQTNSSSRRESREHDWFIDEVPANWGVESCECSEQSLAFATEVHKRTYFAGHPCLQDQDIPDWNTISSKNIPIWNNIPYWNILTLKNIPMWNILFPNDGLAKLAYWSNNVRIID